MVCGCIVGWQSVVYEFSGHLDFVSRIIVSGACFLYYLRKESQIWCMDASLEGYVAYQFLVTESLTYDLVSRIIVSGAYHLYYRDEKVLD